jgi:hypothetical protein
LPRLVFGFGAQQILLGEDRVDHFLKIQKDKKLAAHAGVLVHDILEFFRMREDLRSSCGYRPAAKGIGPAGYKSSF